jgi:hypothetical protein
MGGIQPEILYECFTPARVASGLVSRVLVVAPPEQQMFWTETEISDEMDAMWTSTIMALRTAPFASFCPQTSTYTPIVLQMEPTAKHRFVDYYNTITHDMPRKDASSRKYSSTARTTVGRLAIAMHGLWCRHANRELTSDVDIMTMDGSIRVMTWALNEQLRVFGLAGQVCATRVSNDILSRLRQNANTEGIGSSRKIYKREKKTSDEFRQEIQPLIDNGSVVWMNAARTLYRIVQR